MENVIQVEQKDDIVVIHLVFNEINLQQREELKAALGKELRGDRKKFIIDLARVGFVSSMVMALIVFFSKAVRSAEGNLKLCGLSPDAASVFELTHLDQLFEIYETRHDAVESFKNI